MEYALSGGEDYTLLITVSPDREKTVREAYEKTFETPLFLIGWINDSQRLEMVDPSGALNEVTASGWDHFK